LGANDEYWKLAKQAIPELYKDQQDCLINLLKLCRNVVAGDVKNQNLAMYVNCSMSRQYFHV
jgi:hypothetical protein